MRKKKLYCITWSFGKHGLAGINLNKQKCSFYVKTIVNVCKTVTGRSHQSWGFQQQACFTRCEIDTKLFENMIHVCTLTALTDYLGMLQCKVIHQTWETEARELWSWNIMTWGVTLNFRRCCKWVIDLVFMQLCSWNWQPVFYIHHRF